MLGEVWGSTQPGLSCPYFRQTWEAELVAAAVSSRSPSGWLQAPSHLSSEAAALAVRFGLVLGSVPRLFLTSGPAGTSSSRWAAACGGSPRRQRVGPQSHACEVLHLLLLCPRLLLYI